MDNPEERANQEEMGPEGVPTVENGDGVVLGLGERIGPYKLLRILGEGGCGIVYLTEQQHPVKRRVALKLVKPGMDTKQVIARFEAERQALALLDHPNIAHVFDAGTTEAGRPYFAMEYIKGVPINEHCDRERLAIEDRLKLFGQVCDAVHYAHQKGIIHRDIKPSNIMVTIYENRPLPVVIDFGVAKAIARSLTEQTLFTEQGQLIGTPEFMSPEQAEMTNLDIDTRSDIYSLGVLLYELLTGALPFDPAKLREAAIGEIQRIVREEEPPRPSTRLRGVSGEESTRLAHRRRTDVHSLKRQLQGDLDWIITKALEKDRTRRYDSAAELRADIKRHLNSEPVHAGPPTVSYKLHKFVRRHRIGVIAASLIVAALVSGVILAAYGLIQAQRERDRAIEAKAEAVVQRREAEKQLALYLTAEKARKDLENYTEKLTSRTKAADVLRQPLVFAAFLDAWGQSNPSQMAFVLNFLSRGSKERQAALFLCDPNTVAEKVDSLRRNLSEEDGWFAEFVIGENHLKNGSQKEAFEAYRRSYEAIRRFSQRDNFRVDGLIIERIKQRLDEFGDIGRQRTRETPQTEK